MIQVSIEINGNLHFTYLWHGETFKSSYDIIDIETLLPQIEKSKSTSFYF